MIETGGSEIQGYSLLHSKFQASLGYLGYWKFGFVSLLYIISFHLFIDPNKEKSLIRYIQCQILPTTQGRRNINIGLTIPLNRMEMNTTKLML